MKPVLKRPAIVALMAAVLAIALSMGWMQPAHTTEPSTQALSNAASDPVALGIMQGYPLPPEEQVTLQNWLAFPKNRWAFRNMQALFPTSQVMRSGNVARLRTGSPLDVKNLTFTDKDGQQITGQQYFDRQYVDAFLVLHRGKLVDEQYFASMRSDQPHLWMSTTKSLTGLIAQMLADQGVLDLSRTAASYVSELAETPYGNATLQHLLNMEVNVDLQSSVAVADIPADYWSSQRFIDGLMDGNTTQAGENGERFNYINTDPQTIGLVMTHVTGKSWGELVEEMVWSKLGVEHDANIFLDVDGQAAAAGGFSATPRDTARFAEMIRNNGFYNGRQIVPERVIAKLRSLHDNVAIFAAGNVHVRRPGMSYTDYWYQVNDGQQTLECLGVFGQHYHINPTDQITIIQHSSYLNSHPDGEDYFRMVDAITRELRKR